MNSNYLWKFHEQ